MNTLKKLYCRTFQTAFKLAIPVLPYRSPKVLKSVKKVPRRLKKKNITKVLIITDSFVHSLGLVDSLKESLEASGIKYTVYDKTVPNPTVENVEEAREEYVAKGCQALIGIGGGSSMDCAKAVGARIARPRKPISKMEGILRIAHKTPYTIAIPTTAGTGSETTVTTVITDHVTHHKFPISDFVLIPDVAVLDAEITKTLPPSVTATTGMDALVHAIEAYIGRSTVKSTRKDALKAAKLIAENLEKAYNNGDDMTARENMLKAAFLAGRAFSKSYVGYCHAVAHSLGGEYHIPHGLANAVLLPYTLEMYGKTIYSKLKDIAIAMHITDENVAENVAAKRLIEKLREMNKNMDIPDKLKGIKEKDIPKLAGYADKEANPLYPVPVLKDKIQLQQLYYDVMEEEI